MPDTNGPTAIKPQWKICKACEPCRARKVRCDGGQPCSQLRCQEEPLKCSYREKPRIRQSRKVFREPSYNESTTRLQSRRSRGSSAMPSAARSAVEGGIETTSASDQAANLFVQREASAARSARPRHSISHDRELNPHVSIVATHETPQNTDSPQLFYGPSSNFAFLQQLHRALITTTARGTRGRGSDVEEGGPGLDMFLQRNIFFGTPHRVRLDSMFPTGHILTPQLDLSQAASFMENFKAGHSHWYPFLTHDELDDLRKQLEQDITIITGEANIPLQKRIIILAMLALGALSTPYTEQAEYLYAIAKREALLFSEATTLSIIQYTVLLAGYQIHAGRPNSAYIHLGDASRNAFSMGLHRDSPAREVNAGILKERQKTLWCLYFHERWTCLTLGRKSAISIYDISCSFPEHASMMAAICQLACITEDCVELIYTKRCESLRQLYLQAEKIHARLRQFSEAYQTGASFSISDPMNYGHVASFQLNAHYYHAVLLTFRPFLVANAAMSAQARQKEGIWLRPACRFAVGAAQDTITFINDIFRSSPAAEVCKSLRYTCYFLECCCSVLLHESLWTPSMMHYNLEYIEVAIGCLELLVGDFPATLALHSIRRISQAVEYAIAQKGNFAVSTPGSNPSRPPPGMMPPLMAQSQVPGMNTDPLTDQQHIYFTDLWDHGNSGFPGATMPGLDNEMQDVNIDVMTTDLLHFFALDMGQHDGGTNLQ